MSQIESFAQCHTILCLAPAAFLDGKLETWPVSLWPRSCLAFIPYEKVRIRNVQTLQKSLIDWTSVRMGSILGISVEKDWPTCFIVSAGRLCFCSTFISLRKFSISEWLSVFLLDTRDIEVQFHHDYTMDRRKLSGCLCFSPTSSPHFTNGNNLKNCTYTFMVPNL